jgi:NAD-dependent SIR2 family protein deacetylase
MNRPATPGPAIRGQRAGPIAGPDALASLAEFVARHPRLFVLTGAGCSTPSGIPDYRDHQGRWKGAAPIQHARFMRSPEARRRYWARSLLGWPRIGAARPNPAHRALAALEAAGRIHQLVTQNVDGLHQKAGSRRVIDLHGRLDLVDCQRCGRRERRERFQLRLRAANPGFESGAGALRPDGDVQLPGSAAERFRVPDCPSCGGILKPHVVFFGGRVPPIRVERAMTRLDSADALLAVGTSLVVYSGYRFARRAAELGLPMAAINLGVTRADPLLDIKLNAACDQALPAILAQVLKGLETD